MNPQQILSGLLPSPDGSIRGLAPENFAALEAAGFATRGGADGSAILTDKGRRAMTETNVRGGLRSVAGPMQF